MNKLYKSGFIAAALWAVVAVRAQTAVYQDPLPDTPFQTWSGMLGNDFSVNVGNLVVSQIGAYTGVDAGYPPNTNINVQLFDVTALYDNDNSTNSIVAVSSLLTFTDASPGAGSPYSFKDVAPITLTAGSVYSIQASGWGVGNPNFNTNFPG